MWPSVFELDIGEEARLAFGDQIYRVRLLQTNETWEPDYWTEANPSHRTYRAARVSVSVDGVEADLWHRPYELPVTVNGLRLYVETIYGWATECEIAQITDLDRYVRFSALPADAPWGDESLVFPIQDYRWHSSSYNNTWSSLVPYNKLYYHRGEDYGAIPDRLPVLASISGTIVASPVPSVQGSNSVGIMSASGTVVRYAHMNIETIDPDLVVGARVEAGQVLGKTGCTWNGSRSQWADPHLHVTLERDGRRQSPYPFLVRAYLNAYPEGVLAVAGGYQYATAGQGVALDGTRSVPLLGRSIASYVWKLHDGTTTEGPVAAMCFDRPGLYAEELIVIADDGSEDRDFCQVRVYDPGGGRNIAYGWAYHSPVRGIRVGTPVLFWNRLLRTVGPTTIDYGDGTAEEIAQESAHRYAGVGLYTVTLSARGPRSEPTMVKMRVVVEE